MEQTTIKRHYHLLTGEVIFQPNGTEDVNAVRVNGVLADEDKQIPVRLLAKAQQILQMNFFKRADVTPETVKVVDCVMLGFTYLGEFTAEEFHKEPEGMRLQERETAPQTPDGPTPVTTITARAATQRVSLEDALAGASKN